MVKISTSDLKGYDFFFNWLKEKKYAIVEVFYFLSKIYILFKKLLQKKSPFEFENNNGSLYIVDIQVF